LFSHQKYNIERLIEFGPSPTLTGMASRTLKLKYDQQDTAHNMSREILCISKNIKEIYYQYEDEVETEAAPAAVSEPTAVSPAAVAVAAPVAASGPVAAVADEPLKAVETLRVLVAQGLKKPLNDVPLSKAIKDLVGGKSTLQNELLGSARKSY
jgi:fatty acid synthase subunit alpha